MAPSTAPRGARFAIISSTLRLAIWRLRRTWQLLLVTGLGIVMAVMLVCAVPLFSRVTTTAGLRGAFATVPASSTIAVNVTTTEMQSERIQGIGALIDGALREHLGDYLRSGSQFSLQLPLFPVVKRVVHGDNVPGSMQAIGYDETQFASHATLLAGRLPQSGATHIEIALTQATADALGVTVGSTILLDTANTLSTSTDTDIIAFTVVGIVAINADDVFFHRLYFEPQRIEPTSPAFFSRMIATNTDLVTLLQSPSIVGPLRTETQLDWYYALDPSHLDASVLDSLIAQANALQITLPNALLDLAGSPRGTVSGDVFTTLPDYQARINIVGVPITFLLVLIVAFVLFFVSVMAEIVIDRQSDAIAILRSRGTSRVQIFGALITQSLGLTVIALIAGPLLALVTVLVIARHTLAPQAQGALHLLTDHPLRVAYDLPWSAIVVVLAALCAMLIAINRATSADMLVMRRESSRSTHRPAWQRLNLDVVAVLLAVTGYLIDTLVLNRVGSAVQYQLGFLGLVAPSFLLLAGTLLFFRSYPLLLRVLAWVAGRARGPVPILALTQMSRSPRQSMRGTFLLAFATALMIFSIIFVTSETQHLRDVASFSAGADFSGALPFTTESVTATSDGYSQIPGVTSISLGYVVTLSQSAGIANQQLLAVDPDHYAQTATWDAHNSTQSLASLMAQLVSHRDDAKYKRVIPAILNGGLWDALQLTQGAYFSLLVPGYDGGKVRFVAIARVDHIQGIYDSAQFLSGGIMVDYQSYATVFSSVAQPAPPNVIWLRTAQDTASLASVRQALTTGKRRLANLIDRRALTQLLITDPLQIDLNGLLTVGAISAIALALVGVLTTSWLNARGRLTNFAVLRALGTTPREIAGILVWEQGITYSVALILGGVLGALLSQMLLPMLAFANARTMNGDLIGAANLPAIQPIAPLGALALALGTLVVICLGALVLMTLVVARPSVSATLRLNED